MRTLKANHQFTKAQLESLNRELKKISGDQVKGLKGVKIEPRSNYWDIKIRRSNYVNDVFLSFTDVSNPEHTKSYTYGIDVYGNVDKDVRKNMEFETLADRVSFFANLENINIKEL